MKMKYTLTLVLLLSGFYATIAQSKPIFIGNIPFFSSVDGPVVNVFAVKDGFTLGDYKLQKGKANNKYEGIFHDIFFSASFRRRND